MGLLWRLNECFFFSLSPKNNSWNILSSTVWNCHYSKIKYWWVLTLRIAGLSAMIISGITIFIISTYYCLTHVTVLITFCMNDFICLHVQCPGSVPETGGVSLSVVSGLYIPWPWLTRLLCLWISPNKNTGASSFPFSNRSSWLQGSILSLLRHRQILTIWAGTQSPSLGFFANNHQNNLPKLCRLSHITYGLTWLL